MLENLPAAILAISGRAEDDVYAVGADPGDGIGPYILHWNGSRWRRLHPDVEGDLWWISDRTISDDFLLSGKDGLVLRLEPYTGRFEQLVPAGDETMYGAWGAEDGHLWTVGGDVANELSGGVVWVRDPATEPQPTPVALRASFPAPRNGGGQHLGGAQWSVDTEAPKVFDGQLPTLYKVWGVDASDVWAAGLDGVVIRFDGIRWTSVATGTSLPLYTVHGQGDDVVVVGGDGEGVLLELMAGRFIDRTPPDMPRMNGVFVAPDGTAIAAGERGVIARRTEGEWALEETALDPALDYHAVWMDPQGGVWIVGGDLSDLTKGVIAYAGRQNVNGEIVEDVPCPPSDLRGGNTTVSYLNDIRPLFQAHSCMNATCHGGAIPSSGYSLASWESTFGPGIEARGLGLCDVVPGSPEKSFLFEKLGPSPRFGVRMPDRLPPLSDEELALVETWIREGAQDDSTPAATRTPTPTLPPTNTPAMGDCNDPGIICTVAGTGMSVFDGDGRDALDTSLYYPIDVVFQPGDGLPIIDDWNNLRGRRIESDGTVQTIIGTGLEADPMDGALATETSLHHASELTFDPQGRMLVAGDHVPFVFRVGLDQRVQIVAGNGSFETSGDGGPAIEAGFVSPFGVLPDGEGGFWVADVDGHTIRNVDADGIVRRVAGTGTRGYSGDGGPAAEAELDGPTRMALDTDGNLIFCDTGNHVLRRIRSDGTIETFAGIGVPAYSGDGGPASQAGLSSPYDLLVDSSGAIYVADSRNNVVRLIRPDGTISTIIGSGIAGFAGDRGPAGEARLRQPSGLAFAPDGSLWIADTLNHRVRRVAGVVPASSSD